MKNLNAGSIIAIIIALFSSTLVLLATKWGVGLTPDSINYIKGANSIALSGNLQDLSAHWPPLYFIYITIFSLLTGDIWIGARWGQIILVVINILLLATIIARFTRNTTWTIPIVLFITLLSPTIFPVHLMAWSEALFLTFLLTGILFLSMYEVDLSRKYLVTAALAIGLATVTRYVGVPLIAAVAVMLFLYALKKRLSFTDLITFSVISILPIGIWIIRNELTQDFATNRELVFHPITWPQVEIGFNNIAGWLQLPGNYWPLAMIAITAIYTLYIYQRFAKPITGNTTSWLVIDILIIFPIVYLITLLISISFLDAHTPLDARILSVSLLPLGVGTVILIDRINPTSNIGKIAQTAVIGILLVISLLNLMGLSNYIQVQTRNGIGFNAREWVLSPISHLARSIPDETIIYTNIPEVFYVHHKREAVLLPRIINPGTKQPMEQFSTDYNRLRKLLDYGQAVVVYFNLGAWRWYLPTKEMIIENTKAPILYQGQDGVILGQPSAASKIYD